MNSLHSRIKRREGLCAKAPGKIILSGEHAVVYGAPALAMAVNRFAVTSIGVSEAFLNLVFNLPNLRCKKSLLNDELQYFCKKLHEKYQKFLAGELSIREVLSRSFDLMLYAVGFVSNRLNLQLPAGMWVDTRADIPIGCGMGSSAATIMSSLWAVNHYFARQLSTSRYLEMAQEVENMQHGRSSGVDVYLALHGGAVKFQHGQIKKCSLPEFDFYVVNTGRPQTTTGECVNFVKPRFTDQVLLDEFVNITESLEKAVANNSLANIHELILANEKLLERIGVVPERVQDFIAKVHAFGGAAKICGAGAVAGDSAGVVLVLHDDRKELERLVKQFNYTILEVAGEKQGARVEV